MNGATMTKRDIRRTGVPATIKGKPNPEYARFLPRLPVDMSGLTKDEMAMVERVAASKTREPEEPRPSGPTDGPTTDRLSKSQGAFSIGDDKQGTRIYHFHDSPLDRLYSRLIRGAGRRDEDLLRKEYTALQKLRHHWHASGLESSPKSVDLDRIFCSDPGSMSGMAKTERQAFHRQMYRKAADVIGHETAILLDNFVCYEWERGIASGMSPYLFRKTIRDAGQKLAHHWGI